MLHYYKTDLLKRLCTNNLKFKGTICNLYKNIIYFRRTDNLLLSYINGRCDTYPDSQVQEK